MSSEYSTKDLLAELRKFGGLWIVAILLNVVFTALMFDPFGRNRFDEFTAKESLDCEATLLKESSAVKRAKIENDKGMMFLVYLKLLNEHIDGVEWECIKREGFCTRVTGTVGSDMIEIYLYPEKYSFSVGFYDVDGELTFCDKSVVTYRALLLIVREWVRKITPVVV
jgi:hypothetical protein